MTTDAKFSFDGLQNTLDSLPAEATISRQMLQRAISSGSSPDTINIQETIFALLEAVISLELSVKGVLPRE